MNLRGIPILLSDIICEYTSVNRTFFSFLRGGGDTEKVISNLHISKTDKEIYNVHVIVQYKNLRPIIGLIG